jgi:hypothetical protein
MKYCETNTYLKRIDLQSPCRRQLKQFNPFTQTLQPRDNHSDLKLFGILKKISHEVTGTGFECTMEKYIIQTFMGFFTEIT